ncbi:UNVERIFIED_CONTAM: hypothetical protein HDU68_008526 [Siphonaria sp. JEL0065]|nr:hypothetical protein HDU68_008526 [Siphonaria sp. JEL0065]
MATVTQNETFNVLWTRVDPNDGTIEGTQRVWLYCDANSSSRNAGASNEKDGVLGDLKGELEWYNTQHDLKSTLTPTTNYTRLGYYSYCNSKTGNPDDLLESNCLCLMADTGADTKLALNTNYSKHCSGKVTIPQEWGTGVFSCVWFYQINKAGYFNRYPFGFEVFPYNREDKMDQMTEGTRHLKSWSWKGKLNPESNEPLKTEQKEVS